MNEHDQQEQRSAIEERMGDTLTDLTADVLMFADYAPHDVVAMTDDDVRATLATNFGDYLRENWESIRFEELRARFKRVIDCGLDDGEPEDEDYGE